MMKDNSTFINLSDSDTAIFQEGISYKEPSIFPDTYLEKLLNLTNKYGCKKNIVDNDTLTSQLECDERNLSLLRLLAGRICQRSQENIWKSIRIFLSCNGLHRKSTIKRLYMGGAYIDLRYGGVKTVSV